jgi:hypothetical protein
VFAGNDFFRACLGAGFPLFSNGTPPAAPCTAAGTDSSRSILHEPRRRPCMQCARRDPRRHDPDPVGPVRAALAVRADGADRDLRRSYKYGARIRQHSKHAG